MTDSGPGSPAAERRPAARALRRLARRALVRRVTVTMPRWDTIRISREVGGVVTPGQDYRLDDPAAAPPRIGAPSVRVVVPDPAALGRLAAAGLLRGSAAEVTVRVERLPAHLRHGLALPRLGRDTEEVSFRSRGGGAVVRIASRGRRDLAQRLARLADAVRRPRGWGRPGGDVYALDRTDFLAGAAPTARGRLAVTPAVDPPAVDSPPAADGSAVSARGADAVGPFVPAASVRPSDRWPLDTAIANPYGRRLLGAAEPLRIQREPRRDGATIVVRRVADGTAVRTFTPTRSAEHALLEHNLEKYAVADLGHDASLLTDRFGAYVVDTLAACGVVLASRDPRVRDLLADRKLPVVRDPAEVRDLRGYRLSVATANRALISADDTLRHTPLAGGNLPLPTISVLVASKRPDALPDCLAYLAAQSYPTYEVVVGTHGYTPSADRVAQWRERGSAPLRFVALPETATLGEVLGTLSRHAEGELLTKVDDDDPYGPDHLTDLLLAHHTSGADLVAKSARFVYLAEHDRTIDRAWAAPESFDVTPAGGTLLLARSTLDAVGGWSRSARQVDADLVARVRAAGGILYRTHGLGYVYVRHTDGHTFRADAAALLEQGESVWDGIPQPLLAAYDEPTDAMTRA